MKTPHPPQSATSLPVAPRDDAKARSTKYLVMMAVRIACFGAMVLVTPYGWYTWVFAAGAVFLPYIAVVIANVGAGPTGADALVPERAVAGTAPTAQATQDPAPTVITIAESPAPPPADAPDATS